MLPSRIYQRWRTPRRRRDPAPVRLPSREVRQVSVARGPDFSDVMEELVPLRDALRMISSTEISLSECLDLYIANYFGSDLKVLALGLFARFYAAHRKRLSKHLSALSDLAAIFVDEAEFIEEYNKVCYDIKQIVKVVKPEHGVAMGPVPMVMPLPAHYM